MAFLRDEHQHRFKWHIVIIVVVVGIVVGLTLFTDIFQQSPYQRQVRAIPQTYGQSGPSAIWSIAGVILLVTIVVMLSRLLSVSDTLKDAGAKLDNIAEAMEKNRAVLTQIRQSNNISEPVKEIVFRDGDMQSLREVVFDKLQQHDFDSALKVIDQIASSTTYKGFAQELQADVEKYRHATTQERENQVIVHIERLLDAYQWTKASMKIERLIKAFPESEKAKQMRQKLVDKKGERKKALLSTWDDAVKRQATDESLGILRELDLYLTPNEGLALQEAARDVFRTKLHNLGVQFSFSISEKQWARALKTGQQIIKAFPNSKMAQEIRERINVLRQKAQQ